jgi:tetratricopeptide (TPR) repeat protein/transcriptional regulator with XRE-family HTH domain
MEQGWSQQQLADKVGTTPITVSRWENGATSPSPYFRGKLREVFDKTPAELDILLPTSDEPKVWSVPFTRNPFFTGREDLLALLHKRLSTDGAAALTQPQAISGLGGIGKTQTAVEYAHRHADDFTHVFWMRAATHETLASDFAALAERLDLPETEEPDQSVVVAAVKRWLANHDGWLLILDNADDLLLAREFLPTRHKGYIVYTTRSQATGAVAANIEVGKLSLEDGALLLLRWGGRLEKEAPFEAAREADREAALLIATEMDGLPLAIVQAAAYIEEIGCSLHDYLSLFRTRRKDLLARRSPLLDYPGTVATTWSLSFERVERQSPAAAEVLRFCAFLAPDAIPEDLLTHGASELGAVLAAEAGDRLKLDAAIEVLLRYSLVRRDRDTHTLTIHRLVQAVLKESMDEPTRRVWAARTVRAVSAAFPEVKASTAENQQSYLPHLQECATLINQYQLHFAEAAQLLYRAGYLLYYYGFFVQSYSFHQQALAIREQVLWPEHPAVAESLNALGVLSRNQGIDQQAEEFHQRALTIREQTLGPDHLVIAESLNNLAVIYRSQGKYEQARSFLQRALTISSKVLGSEHPDSLVTLINLAKLYLEQGKYDEAGPLLSQTLAISERILEPGHPLIAHAINLLARLSYEQGNYERAEALWNQSLAILVKTLGPEHPAAAERLNDLAELYAAQGRYAQAQSRVQRAVSIAERTLGTEHPETIAYREHLARIRSK